MYTARGHKLRFFVREFTRIYTNNSRPFAFIRGSESFRNLWPLQDVSEHYQYRPCFARRGARRQMLRPYLPQVARLCRPQL